MKTARPAGFRLALDLLTSRYQKCLMADDSNSSDHQADPPNGSSPRAAGPAGSQFEVSVGVHYALAVLAQTEAFGLPGFIASRIAFQRVDQGHPLDDIVLYGEGPAGACTLEIQAKRSLAFTKGNSRFGTIIKDMIKGRAIDPARRFAVAIERTSLAIENGVQEVLELAKYTSDDKSFRALLDTPGRSNQPMRDFVEAFEHHHAVAGGDATADTFSLLRAFTVLTFDYARPNSIAEHTDRMRSAALTNGVTDPYDELIALIMRVDAIGGDLDRKRLIECLEEQGVTMRAAPSLVMARSKVEELSAFALEEIDTKIAGAHLLRTSQRHAVEACLDAARQGTGFLELSGPGGSGKSALLKASAAAQAEHAQILVLSPDRTPPGGWPALQSQLGIDATADAFLLDLACDGGGIVFVDGLDRFRSEAERKTVSDIILAAARTRGVTVAFTARPGWQQAHEFSEAVIRALQNRDKVEITGLNDTEADALAAAVPQLAALLQPGHPAKALARNPFILKRFATTTLDPESLISEAAFGWSWWMSGGHAVDSTDGEQRTRRRILFAVADAQLKGASLVDLKPEAADANAVASLIADEVLTEVSTDRVKFKHDLFSDWAVAAYLSEDAARFVALTGNDSPPFWLARGTELAFRRLAEDRDASTWYSCLANLRAKGVHEEWIGLALLALVRSEQANTLLDRHQAALLADDGDLAAKLIWRVIGAHSIKIPMPAKTASNSPEKGPIGLALPDISIWVPLVAWASRRFSELPSKALSAAVELFQKWILLSAYGEMTVAPVLLDRLADMLVAHVEDMPKRYVGFKDVPPKIRYPANRDTSYTARLTLAAFADKNPGAAERYLTAIAASERVVDELYELLNFPFSMPKAAPKAFAAAFIEGTRQEYAAHSESDRRHGRSVSISRLEHRFSLSKCGISLFHDIFQADADQGIVLVRTLTRMTEDAIGAGGSFDLELAGGTRTITPTSSYSWPRGHGPSQAVSKALAAMEHWAHGQIEAGVSLQDVIVRLAGDGPISGAFLLVIVDITLSHGMLGAAELHELMASPDLLALDSERYQHDYLDGMRGGGLMGGLQAGPEADRPIEQALLQRASRSIALHDVFIQVALRVPKDEKRGLKSRLEGAVQRLGAWEQTHIDWHDPVFMASYALRALDVKSYREETRTVNDENQTGWVYNWPEDQAKWIAEHSESAAREHSTFNRSLAIRMAMDDEKNDTKPTTEDAEAVLSETADAKPTKEPLDHDPNDPWIARLGAAAFLARMYPEGKLRGEAPRLKMIFEAALRHVDRSRSNLRYDVMYDPAALAFAGLLYLYRDERCAPDDRTLLDSILQVEGSSVAALLHHPAAAKALGQDRLKACMRVGFQSCVFARRQNHDEPVGAYEARKEAVDTESEAHKSAELAWLSGGGDEPAWFVPPRTREKARRRGVLISGGRTEPETPATEPEWPDVYFDGHTGDQWLKALKLFAGPEDLKAIFLANREWLLEANKAVDGDNQRADIDRHWTRPLFECAARTAKDWSEGERETHIFAVLDQFAPEPFFSMSAAFLVESDLRHIEGSPGDTAYLAGLRQRVWRSLEGTKGWERHRWSRDGRLEIYLHELVAGLFMKLPHGFGDTQSYTGGLSEAQLLPFAKTLTDAASSAGPCPTISSMFLDVLELLAAEIASRYLLSAAHDWAAEAKDDFWRTVRIGERVCAIAGKGIRDAAEAKEWQPISNAVAAAGVPEGEALKKRIQSIIDSGTQSKGSNM